MSIICKLFGHKALTVDGYAGGTGYAKSSGGTVDGIGTWHLFLRAECPRCDEEYSICNIHVPSDTPPGWPHKRK